MEAVIAASYEIMHQIGAGGGGVVFLARHLRLDKLVVLKADKRRMSAKTDLRREVDALKNLSHSYIPQVYDFINEDSTVYTVMDYIEGESFDKLLERGERFTQPQVIAWARQLLEALCYLHSRPPYGILHSDIKPANIMLKPQGDVCLIDFNIALALGEEGAVAVGRSHGYASPEHFGVDQKADVENIESTILILDDTEKTDLLTGEDTLLTSIDVESPGMETSGKRKIILDVRSDIYGLGATLYHLLTGQRPATSASDVKAIPDSLCSPALITIITKSMNPNPALRYQTAAEMLFDFTHLREHDPRTIRHKKMRWFTGIAIVVLFIAGGLATFTGLKQMEQTQSAYALAEYSEASMRAGDVLGALANALKALPQRDSIFVPPYTTQAQSALAAAVGVYDLADGFKPFRTVQLPSEPFKVALSPDGKTIVAVYAYEVTVFDSGLNIMAQLPTVKSALADVDFLNDEVIVYAGEKGICVYDVAMQKELWSGKPATDIAVSADKETIATIYRDEDFAVIYDANGSEKMLVDFNNKRQEVLADDSFANPNDNLLELNRDGSLLAINFADGSLEAYDLTSGERALQILEPSGFRHFEGGFAEQYFAFSASDSQTSVFAVVDMQTLTQAGGFQSDEPFGVYTTEEGIYISSENIVVKLEPISGEQQEVAYTNAWVTGFALDGKHVIVATENNGYEFFEEDANFLVSYENNFACDFICVAGEAALVGSRSTPNLRVLHFENNGDKEVFAYEADYTHDETRINTDMARAMLFSPSGFRIYDLSGTLLNQTFLPNPDLIHDQQYSRESGNLAVMYPNALRIYAGKDGELLYEATGLKSVFYAAYGVSILTQDNQLQLIDIDTAEVAAIATVEGGFAAYCGLVVDSSFLAGGKLIGAAQVEDGFVFVVSDGTHGIVYNDQGSKLFNVDAEFDSEAFVAGDTLIVSPLHGTPTAYSIATKKLVRELEKDAHLTYVTQFGEHIITEYITADGRRYGLILDTSNFLSVALLPGLTDMTSESLFFDYKTGTVRQTRIYSIDELINLAEEVVNELT